MTKLEQISYKILQSLKGKISEDFQPNLQDLFYKFEIFFKKNQIKNQKDFKQILKENDSSNKINYNFFNLEKKIEEHFRNDLKQNQNPTTKQLEYVTNQVSSFYRDKTKVRKILTKTLNYKNQIKIDTLFNFLKDERENYDKRILKNKAHVLKNLNPNLEKYFKEQIQTDLIPTQLYKISSKKNNGINFQVIIIAEKIDEKNLALN